ncbi:3-isopropylmalate dehydratase small subunit [compost metagenome]
MVPVALPADQVSEVASALASGDPRLTVDLTDCEVRRPDGATWPFAIDIEAREMLLEGMDSIALTLKLADRIQAMRHADRLTRPWAYLGDAPS